MARPAAEGLLGGVAKPGYWDQVLDLRPPAPSVDTGDVGGALHQSPGVGSGPTRRADPGSAAAPGAGGGAGGGGGAAAAAEPPPIPDWEQALIAMGLPPELVTQITDYYRNHADDADVQPKVLALVRGSDWWKTTFSGFWEGYSRGLFTDETGYRAWATAADDAFKRFYNRPMTAAERSSFLAQGFNPSTIEQIGAGHAFAEANRPDLQWATGAFDQAALADAEREAYGQQASGRDSALGETIKARVEKALATAQRVAQGTLATPNLSVGGAGLAAPSLNPKPKPDVGA